MQCSGFSGQTALTLAAFWGRFEIVQELVRAGWSPSVTDSEESKTPLQWAQEGQRNQWRQVVGLLDGGRRRARAAPLRLWRATAPAGEIRKTSYRDLHIL